MTEQTCPNWTKEIEWKNKVNKLSHFEKKFKTEKLNKFQRKIIREILDFMWLDNTHPDSEWMNAPEFDKANESFKLGKYNKLIVDINRIKRYFPDGIRFFGDEV